MVEHAAIGEQQDVVKQGHHFWGGLQEGGERDEAQCVRGALHELRDREESCRVEACRNLVETHHSPGPDNHLCCRYPLALPCNSNVLSGTAACWHLVAVWWLSFNAELSIALISCLLEQDLPESEDRWCAWRRAGVPMLTAIAAVSTCDPVRHHAGMRLVQYACHSADVKPVCVCKMAPRLCVLELRV